MTNNYTFLTVDQILAMSEDELRGYGQANLVNSLVRAENRLGDACEDLDLAIQEIEHPDDFDYEMEVDLDTEYELTCKRFGFARDDTDRLWFTSDWVDGKTRTLAERLADLRESKRAEARRNREDFETYCWAWSRACLGDPAGGVRPMPPVNPWPYRS